MMSFLHIEAVSMGASKIRLRVRPENEAAKALYTSFGYEFSGEIDRKEEVWWHTF
jgi:ribosomal protein S18 acetylase RimI-like enzyme